MGHGKMAAVALATEWRAGGESERLCRFFSPFLLDVQVIVEIQRICEEGSRDTERESSVSLQLHSRHQQ